MQKNEKFSSAGGFAPKLPCLRRLGALPPYLQTPIGLWQLWVPPPDPQNSPPYFEFLDTRLFTMMQYVHCLRNVHNQSTAICRQIICVDIEVEYFCDNIIYHYPTSVCIFCEYNAQNLVWNWYGSMEDCLPFHS